MESMMIKKFSTKHARRGGIPVELDQWLKLSDPDDKVTLIYRLPTFVNPDVIATALTNVGVTPESVGKNTIVGTVAKKNCRTSLDIKGVLGVEMPLRLSQGKRECEAEVDSSG